MTSATGRVAVTVVPRPPWDPLQLALAALFFFQIWRVQDLFHVLGVSGLPIAATVLPVVLFALGRRDPRRSLKLSQPVLRIACGILALVLLSIPGSLYPGMSFQFFFKDYLRSVVLMLLVAASVRGVIDVRRYAWLLLTGAALFCAVVLTHAKMTSEGRLGELVYYDSNDLALLIVCSLPIAAHLLYQSRSLMRRVLVLGIAVLLMLTLAKTGSRGGFLGLLAAGVYLVVGLRAVPLRKRIGAVALLSVLLVGFASDRYWQMMQTILHPESDYNWSGNAQSGRIEVWKRGIHYMFTHPVFGVGARAFSVAEGTISPEAAGQLEGIGFKWSEAHNSFVEIGAELGIGGLALFLALLAAGYRTLLSIGRGPPGEATSLAQALCGSLVAYTVAGFFLSAAYSAFLYTLLGMTVGLARTVGAVPAGSPRRRSVASAMGPVRRFRPSVL